MLNELRDQIHQNAVEHGWWNEKRSFGEIIALCHSELSEALEEYRNGNPLPNRTDLPLLYYSGGGYVASDTTKCCRKPEGIAIELADCIIRILDYCGEVNIDIDEAIKIKHEYNKTRSYRHGGKVI